VNCEQARLLIGADPRASTPELEAHVAGCPGCSRLRAEMRALDADIARALERPPDLVRRRRSAPPVWRQWALAASVLLATLAVAGLWLLRPSESLAHEVVAHVQREPDSWLSTEHVSAQGIEKTLQASGVNLAITSDRIMYAHSCWFRGHYVPHLVVQTSSGPATVLILRHEQVHMRHSFHEAGMTGVIVPAAQGGSIAVLARGGAQVDALASQMQHEVQWLPEPTDR
jgi:hypothetical protein